MAPNANPNSTNTPLQPHVQPSIRSFFQPRVPKYAPPPSLPTTKLDTHGAVSSGNSTSPSNQLPHVQKSPKTPQVQPSHIQQPQYNTPLFQNSIPVPHPPANSYTDLTHAPLLKPRSASTTLPPQAEIIIPLEAHILPLRRINSLLLPIPYPDSFYKQILSPSDPSKPSFSRVITWTDPSSPNPKVIGGIICRVDQLPSSNPSPPIHEIYIQSLALLSPYRGKGLATSLLETVVSSASTTSNTSIPTSQFASLEQAQEQEQEKVWRIQGLYAHVWTENNEGLDWYLKHGFTKDEKILNGYYRRLKPDTAWVLRRRLNPSDFLGALPSPAMQYPSTAKGDDKEGNRELGVDVEGRGGRPELNKMTKSFQDRRPEREWNDLPEDVLIPQQGLLRPGERGSNDSSRSSSRSGAERGKKKRAYPAAAFGGPGTGTGI